MLGTWTQSLVRELRPCMPQSQKIKKKKKPGFCPGLTLGASVLFCASLPLNPFPPHLTDHPPNTPASQGPHPTPFLFPVSWTTPSRRPQAIQTKDGFVFSSPGSFLLEFPNMFREQWEANYTCDLISQEIWHYLQRNGRPEKLSNLARDP